MLSVEQLSDTTEHKPDQSQTHSVSLDQATQDFDSKPEESQKSSEQHGNFQPTSLVFKVRRYSKRLNKFILLTRHRKLITKCEHTGAEYYAKGM
mmetsp:Transcript_39553/g.39124  ORF Transcript_39553/g.39124 Transcript_39553/m.39124 type:complete len:94 (+) Transcript_39553:216-497(+)|eukprot:CAMPEP_0197014764 /NCGR_PEP_ID=MMETSP1380-20130617/71645_1 /TAXON_ID=5936 /ORGANISM="Euplotes crassus, Strain CT5" /LENGTH=93 /DNA_ID=CAMNT_0042440131 /DNA_START=342 /DNA_END=623 /DNA_ORIENTATION=+